MAGAFNLLFLDWGRKRAQKQSPDSGVGKGSVVHGEAASRDVHIDSGNFWLAPGTNIPRACWRVPLCPFAPQAVGAGTGCPCLHHRCLFLAEYGQANWWQHRQCHLFRTHKIYQLWHHGQGWSPGRDRQTPQHIRDHGQEEICAPQVETQICSTTQRRPKLIKGITIFQLLGIFKSLGVKSTTGTSNLGNWATLLVMSDTEPISRGLCFFCLPTETLIVGLCSLPAWSQGVTLTDDSLKARLSDGLSPFCQWGMALEAPVILKFPFVLSGLLWAMCLVVWQCSGKTIHWETYGWLGYVVMS